ncbi:MAG: hypothetical protein DCF31_13425 [Alphaproteobacteria bacterium]|nr:MAG: hypothetical protein DCF31_13425 [Alphaproteobacteria bacterium]
MKFIIDSQLPPALAVRLTAMGHASWHIGELAALDAPDAAICALAAQRGCAIISKDADFLRLTMSHGVPLLWLRVGNCSNASLLDIVCGRMAVVVATFEGGERIVELR